METKKVKVKIIAEVVKEIDVPLDTTKKNIEDESYVDIYFTLNGYNSNLRQKDDLGVDSFKISVVDMEEIPQMRDYTLSRNINNLSPEFESRLESLMKEFGATDLNTNTFPIP